MHKKGTGKETYFSYKEKNPFFKKTKQKKTTYFYQLTPGNFECAYYIEMSSLTFVVRGQVICKYKFRYSLIYSIIPFLCHENCNEMKAQLCREFSMIKTRQKSKIYVNNTHQPYS